MTRAVLVLLFLASLGVASRVLFPIEKVEVVGNHHLSAQQIRQTTGLEVGGPWLWAWPFKLDNLSKNPWVRGVQIDRSQLAQIRILVEERTPIASYRHNDTLMGLSKEGVFLPDAPQQTPLIEGKGTVPLSSLITLAQAFPNAYRIAFDSSGYRVRGENFNVWATSVRELQDWAKIRKIVQSDALAANTRTAQQDPNQPVQAVASVKSAYVYSWGVSVRR